MDTDGSYVAHATSSAATSLKVGTLSGPEWLVGASPPWYLQQNGEALKVTGCTTDTPAFIAAGTAAHGNNASVAPGLPAGMTVDAGQLLVLLAAIRNFATGEVDTDTLEALGWTTLAAAGNVALLAKHYVTGDTAPTVAFTGGGAGDDTSARIAGFSGLSYAEDLGGGTSFNGSAANVAYPGLTVRSASTSGYRRAKSVPLIAAWKQDDTTGVTAATGFTEAFEASTTTGNDQSIALDYRLDTVATAVTAGSKTWGGGAAAISTAMVTVLRPLQTLTVVRSVNGVSQSIPLGQSLRVWRHGVVAL